MRRHRAHLSGCAAILLFGGMAPAGDSAKVGEKVTDYDFGRLLNGDGRTAFAEFRGQPILLEWWGTR